ncbi:hypothetical protein FOA52_014045 [Chlamydomonas sp. UWO 241]|nr:hypothetical protein FOA52_014045 [Chlamydomonas sp. UWO 241]
MIQVNNTGATCVECMRNLTGEASGLEDFAYACEQYCMNTYTISNIDEHNQCIKCISDGAALTVGKVSPRAGCMTCDNDVDNQDPNKDWACGECTKMTGTVASTTCLDCLREAWVDPCACVDGVERGWLFFDEPSTCVVASGDSSVEAAFTDDELMGGMTADLTMYECAKLADAEGAAVFGITGDQSDGSTGDCYWSSANVPFIDGLVTKEILATCDPTESTAGGCVCLYTPGKAGAPAGEAGLCSEVEYNAVPCGCIAIGECCGGDCVSVSIGLEGKVVGQSSTYDVSPYNVGSGNYEGGSYTFPNCLAAVLAITPTGATIVDVESCSHTFSSDSSSPNADTGPFWWVKLGANYVVTEVEVTGRSGSTCGGSDGPQKCRDRLKGISIYVGSAEPTTSSLPSATSNLLVKDDSAAWTAAGTKTYDASSYPSTFNGQTGQYLSIQTLGAALTLCDVQIYGYLAAWL